MVQFLFVRVGLGVGLADAFRHNLGIAFLVAGVFAILALHSRRVFEKVSTERTSHDIIKLLENKFVTIQLVYLLFPLSNGSLTV